MAFLLKTLVHPPASKRPCTAQQFLSLHFNCKYCHTSCRMGSGSIGTRGVYHMLQTFLQVFLLPSNGLQVWLQMLRRNLLGTPSLRLWPCCRVRQACLVGYFALIYSIIGIWVLESISSPARWWFCKILSCFFLEVG